MGKKSNTVWFMLAATAVNVLLMFIFFTLGFILITMLFTKWPALAENQLVSMMSVLVLFVGSTALTLFLYNKILTWVQKKFKLEDHLYPFMAPKNRRPPYRGE
ncbi:MAG: leader peptide processing enzyme [Spirochaetales bacterium]|nr:leader peptide processing enzyme [Spirochaetales bacterium]